MMGEVQRNLVQEVVEVAMIQLNAGPFCKAKVV